MIEDWYPTAVEGRNKDDMEVVPIRLTVEVLP